MLIFNVGSPLGPTRQACALFIWLALGLVCSTSLEVNPGGWGAFECLQGFFKLLTSTSQSGVDTTQLEDRYFKVHGSGPPVGSRSTIFHRETPSTNLLFAGCVLVLLIFGVVRLSFGVLGELKGRGNRAKNGGGAEGSLQESLSFKDLVVKDKGRGNVRFRAGVAHEGNCLSNEPDKASNTMQEPDESRCRGSIEPTLVEGSMSKGSEGLKVLEPQEEPTSPSSPLPREPLPCLEAAGEWSPSTRKAVSWRPGWEKQVANLKINDFSGKELKMLECSRIVASNDIRRDLGSIKSMLQGMETRKLIRDQWGQSMDAFQAGCVVLNSVTLVCYVTFGRWQKLLFSCHAIFIWWDVRSYAQSVQCVAKEAVFIILFFLAAITITRSYISSTVFGRKRPMATPFLVMAFAFVGLVQLVITVLAGGKPELFLFLWVVYSYVSVQHTRRVQIAFDKYQRELQNDEADSGGLKDDSALAALVIGLVFPAAMGLTPFWSCGLSDFLVSSLTSFISMR